MSAARARGLALGDRGRERPFVDLGRGEELVHRRRERERGAGRVGDGAVGRRGPAQFAARERATRRSQAASTPRSRIAGLEHGAGAVEEPVVAGQAARIVAGRCVSRTQSDASGA